MKASLQCLALFAAVVLCVLPRSVSAQTMTEREFRARVDSVYAAVVRADTTALGRWLSPVLKWSTNSSAQATREQILGVAARLQNPAPRFDVDSVEVQRINDVALVGYRRVDRRELGGVEFPATWRVLDVFVQRRGRWQILRHTQMWLVSPVQPVALDSAAMQAFVGRYRVAPGYVDDVHWDHGHLVATVSGFPPGARLIPVGSSTFSPDGIGALIAFERDANGRVTGYVQGYPDGRIVRRVREP
jgi:hypothetical protein